MHFAGNSVAAISSLVKFVWDQRWCTGGADDNYFHKDLTQFDRSGILIVVLCWQTGDWTTQAQHDLAFGLLAHDSSNIPSRPFGYDQV